MDRHDFAATIGAVLLAAGLGLYDWRLSVIIVGLVFLVFGVLAARGNA